MKVVSLERADVPGALHPHSQAAEGAKQAPTTPGPAESRVPPWPRALGSKEPCLGNLISPRKVTKAR